MPDVIESPVNRANGIYNTALPLTTAIIAIKFDEIGYGG